METEAEAEEEDDMIRERRERKWGIKQEELGIERRGSKLTTMKSSCWRRYVFTTRIEGVRVKLLPGSWLEVARGVRGKEEEREALILPRSSSHSMVLFILAVLRVFEVVKEEEKEEEG